MSKSPKIVISAFVLLAMHALVLGTLGTSRWGAFFSDFIQLVLGLIVVVVCMNTSDRSEKMARDFWRLTALAFAVWLIPQAIGTFANLYHLPDGVRWLVNLLFCFWSVPLALALFLDPDKESKGLDLLVVLDFAQWIVFCIAAYFCFFYIPRQAEPGTDLAYSVWAPYFTGYAIVTGAFLLRALFAHTPMVRQLFARMGAFLALSGIVDGLYYYGPGRGLQPGDWFEILWSILLLIPIVAAATYSDGDESLATDIEPRVQSRLITQLFPLLFPFLILGMFERLARLHLTLAAVIVLASFVCSSARLLVTHLRLLNAQHALRREASHDGLTAIWNRNAILDILRRELMRSNRNESSVGLILADADHFKAVNDLNGHAAGDRALRIIASQITNTIRPYDSAGRYGGEEFLIVAPGCSVIETWELAERIRKSICNRSDIPSAGPNKVTLSLGIVSSDANSDADSLLQAADTALYEAKRLGRNRVEPRPETFNSRQELHSHVPNKS
jgi:diguanylate cyclase (GGDEF)-like protein